MNPRVLAKNLRQLADWLETLPDEPLEAMTLVSRRGRNDSASLALSVATLARLSRVPRGEWIAFIERHKFPIQIRPRDASRDIVGKLFKFLEDEPSAVEYLQHRARSEVSDSPELARALKALLSYRG